MIADSRLVSDRAVIRVPRNKCALSFEAREPKTASRLLRVRSLTVAVLIESAAYLRSVLCVGMVGNALAVLGQMGAEEMSCGAGIEVVGLYARIASPRREGMGHAAQVR